MGSVKDLVWLEKPRPEATGVGRFVFSDRYSVFDWGEMPDRIPDKGKAVCMATAFFFEELERRNIKTHYLGLVENGKVVKLGELERPAGILQFKGVRVIFPEGKDGSYDYSVYRSERGCFLIPLEIIYRNSLPPGSSVFKRLKEGSVKPKDLGLDGEPVPGQELNPPLLDVSTKLESSDRYITWEEAGENAGLTEEELSDIKETTLAVDAIITEKTRPLGLKHEDGKVEFAFDEERNLMLVDAVGTLDECRFSRDGLPVSKEIARIYYRKTEWYREVEDAKKRDPLSWKKLVSNSPPPLPAGLREGIADLYRSFVNELTGRRWFDCPPLHEAVHLVKEWI
jgi:phosphoribosylaminoimidazole-succinocarboxamide synthase